MKKVSTGRGAISQKASSLQAEVGGGDNLCEARSALLQWRSGWAKLQRPATVAVLLQWRPATLLGKGEQRCPERNAPGSRRGILLL